MKFLRRYATLLCCLLLWLPIVQKSAAQEKKEVYQNYRSGGAVTLKADTSYIRSTLQSINALRSSHPDSFRSMAELMLQHSRNISYETGIYESLNKIGLYFRDQGMHDTAISLFRKALPFSKSGKDGNKSYILYNNIGNSYSDLGKYEWALENFYHALEASAHGNTGTDPHDSIAIYINIGIIWGTLKEQERSLNTFMKAEQLALRMRDTVKLIATYVNLGILYYTQENWNKAEYYYKKALQLAQERHVTGYQIYSFTSLARLYLKWEMAENAVTHIREALRLLESYPANADTWLYVQSTLGSVYLYQKEYEKARPILLAALKRAEEGHLSQIIMEVEPDVAALYAATGSWREAYEHAMKYARLKDTLLEQEKGRTLEVWMQSRINEKNDVLLAQQLHIAKQKSQLQAKNFMIGGTVGAAILIMAFFIALVRSYRHKQKLQQSAMLQLHQEQEINQLKALVRGEEQERNRIARELHDGIASQLWAIKLNVDSLQHQEKVQDQQKQKLQTIYQQLDDTTHDVRKTAHNLMPSLLLEEGLATALASLCEKTAKSTGLEVDFLEYGTIPRLDADIELSLYRMIQELIQNVLKHAGNATQLLVQLSCTGMLLNMTVEDNGSGFSIAETGIGMGLQHIQKRIEVMQGHMDLQSIPGKGTTIYLEFDIQHLL